MFLLIVMVFCCSRSICARLDEIIKVMKKQGVIKL